MCPTYVYRCPKCGDETEEVRRVADYKRSPKHSCGRMKIVITGTHRVIGSFEPYRAVGMPGQPYIKTRAEHKASLRRWNKEEVGNDRSMRGEVEASDAEWRDHQAKRKAGIEAEIAESHRLLAKLGE